MRRSVMAAIIVVVVIVIASVAVYFYVAPSGNSSTQTGLVVSIGSSAGAADASDVPKFYAGYQLLPTLGPFSVNINVFDSTNVVAAAVVAGNVQFAETSPNTPVNLFNTDPNIVVVGVASTQPDGILVCSSSSGVTQLGQLATNHEVVEVSSLQDSTYLITAYWLNHHGYNASDVQWKFVTGLANHDAALLAGQVPCGVADSTGTLNLLAQPNHAFTQVASLASLNGTLPLDVWWTTKQFAAAHGDFIVAMLKAQILANEWANNKTAYMAYAPSVVGASISTALLSQSYDLLKGIGLFGSPVWNQSVANTVYYFAEVAALSQKQTVSPPSAWADFSYYNQAAAAVGAG